MTTQTMPQRLLKTTVDILPGVALTTVIAFLGIWLSDWIGSTVLGFANSPISGIMMAIIIGLAVGNLVNINDHVKIGITFSVKRLLKLGIILMGIRIGLGDVLRLGAIGIPLIILCVAGALWITSWLGARLGIPRRMSALIAVGTSICGATAIVATGPAIDAKDEEITYAVANITVFGIIAMFLYPFLAHALFPAEPTSAGLFLGTSIHETAQVAGSGLIYAQLYDAPQALEAATVTKLVRNIFMIVVIPLMAYRYHGHASEGRKEGSVNIVSLFPTFILGFVLMALIRTVGDLTLESGAAFGIFDESTWSAIIKTIRDASNILLAIAMAAVGLNTRFAQLRGLGPKPFYVGFGAAVTVGVLSLAGITLLSAIGLGV